MSSRSLIGPMPARIAWLATSDRNSAAHSMTIEKIGIGVRKSGNRSRKAGAGVQTGRAFAWVEDGEWGGLDFLASDAMVAEQYVQASEIYLKDDADNHTDGVLPWEEGRNIRLAKPMEGVVARASKIGPGMENEQVFFPARAQLVAHHRQDQPPVNSTMVYDPGDDDWKAGLHGVVRVRPWADSWCNQKQTGDGDDPLAVLLNFAKSEGDFSGWGAAHFSDGESTLSAEAWGVLRHGAPKHLMAVTRISQIRRAAIDIDRAIHGDGTDQWSAPVEYTRAPWAPGGKGPFVKRVERRMDFGAMHAHPCGKQAGMWKDMTWSDFREYDPGSAKDDPGVRKDPPVDDPGADDGPPPGATGDADPGDYIKEPGPGITKRPPSQDPGGVKVPLKPPPGEDEPPADDDPGGYKGPITGDPPTTGTPNEVESPSHQGHPPPDGPTGPVTGPKDDATIERTYLAEHNRLWAGRYGFTEEAWNRVPLTGHLIAGAVYDSASPPWNPVKFRLEDLTFDEDGMIEGRTPALGPGHYTFAPANFRLHNLYLTQNPQLPDDLPDFSMGVVAANGLDSRFGMGHRLPDSAHFARGFDIALDYSSDADNPDILIVGRNATGAQSTGALKYNGTILGTGAATKALNSANVAALTAFPVWHKVTITYDDFIDGSGNVSLEALPAGTVWHMAVARPTEAFAAAGDPAITMDVESALPIVFIRSMNVKVTNQQPEVPNEGDSRMWPPMDLTNAHTPVASLTIGGGGGVGDLTAGSVDIYLLLSKMA